jgi:hypothetical protein
MSLIRIRPHQAQLATRLPASKVAQMCEETSSSLPKLPASWLLVEMRMFVPVA